MARGAEAEEFQPVALNLVAGAALDGLEQVVQIAVFKFRDGVALPTNHMMTVVGAGEGVGVAAIGLVDAAQDAAFDQHFQRAVDGDEARLRIQPLGAGVNFGARHGFRMPGRKLPRVPWPNR